MYNGINYLSFVFFLRFFSNFFRLLGVRNFQTSLIILVKPIILESIHCNGGLKNILKINKTKEKLAACWSCFFYQPYALKTRKRAEYIWLKIKFTANFSLVGVVGDPVNIETVRTIRRNAKYGDRASGRLRVNRLVIELILIISLRGRRISVSIIIILGHVATSGHIVIHHWSIRHV